MARRVVMMMGAVATAMAIYPGTFCVELRTDLPLCLPYIASDPFSMRLCADDHWDFSHKLTVDNHKQYIQSEIDAGRTLFVRWIAYSG